jgi:hypothetical protein
MMAVQGETIQSPIQECAAKLLTTGLQKLPELGNY